MYSQTERALLQAEKEVQNTKAKLARLYQENQSAVQTGIRAAVVAGAGFAVGYVEDRYPERASFGGLPLSLTAAGLALGAAAMGYAGKEHAYMVEAAGFGALAAYGYKRGKEQGAEAKAKA